MAQYTIVSESNGQAEMTCMTSTRKSEITKLFNRFVKNMAKVAGYSVEFIRDGYARYTYVGEYGIIEGEYYIVRN